MNVRIAGVVGYLLGVDTAPDRGGDYLARLSDQVPEPYLLFLAPFGEVTVSPAGCGRECIPCPDRNMTVGFRGQRKDHLGSLDVGFDPDEAVGFSFIV